MDAKEKFEKGAPMTAQGDTTQPDRTSSSITHEATATKRGRGRPRVSSLNELERAAVELFIQKGYQGTTIDDVAAAAEVSRSTVFRYVSAKNQLLWLFAGDYLSEMERVLFEEPHNRSMTQTISDALCSSMSLPISEVEIFKKKLNIIATEEEQLAASLAYKLDAAQVITRAIHTRLPASRESLATNAIGHAYLAAAFEAIFHWGASDAAPDTLPDMLREMFEPLNQAYDIYFTKFH